MADIEKLDLKSRNITEEQKTKLKEIFPEVVTEGKIDFEKLRLTLGNEIDEGEERFGMTWPGKRDCFKVIQEPSIGTLKPCREESVDFETTENLFIEGDNLEVLKLLQKSYYGKVKVVCIDPPYNKVMSLSILINIQNPLKHILHILGRWMPKAENFQPTQKLMDGFIPNG